MTKGSPLRYCYTSPPQGTQLLKQSLVAASAMYVPLPSPPQWVKNQYVLLFRRKNTNLYLSLCNFIQTSTIQWLICVYVHICMSEWVYVCNYYACVYICMWMHVFTCVHCVCVWVCSICVYIYVHVHANIYMHWLHFYLEFVSLSLFVTLLLYG